MPSVCRANRAQRGAWGNREMKLREWMFVAEERGGKERREERLGRGREGGLQEEREEFVF